MKKDIKFSTRMASADREKIRALAAKAHMSMSDYVTACCLGKRIVVIDEQKELLRQLKGIGSNVNRLTVLANMGKVQVIGLEKAAGELSEVSAAVDPRQAHEAARRLAEYFDGCEVLVCTHVDREHIHSHCVINSVNFETGKKLHMAKEQLQELMRRNDMICQEMGLPVFDAPTQQARGMGGAEYHTALKGQSWKLRLMNTIDACMKYAADKDAFVSLMASEGYQARWESSRKYITYTTPDGMRCRDNKLHEEKYCKEAMEREFRIRAEIVSARTQAAQHPAGSTSDADTTSRITSHESGVGGTAEQPLHTGGPHRETDWLSEEGQRTAGAAPDPDTDGRTAESGEASGADERTGWEAEREAFFSARHQTAQTAATAPGWPHMGGPADGDGSVASAVVGLGYRLEQSQSDAPVMDSTTMRPHTDRKTLRKKQQKKIAQGHAQDDHEEEQTWQQTM